MLRLLFFLSLSSVISILHSGNNNSTYGLDVNIVYYAFIAPDRDWRSLIGLQLQSLLSTHLLPLCTLNIALASPTVDYAASDSVKSHEAALQRLKDAADFISEIVKNVPKKLTLDVTLGNLFEYPGLLRMWQIAHEIVDENQARNTLFLYFHSKGMVFHAKGSEKGQIDHFLFRTVIEPWRLVLEQFASDEKLNKAGYAVAPDGFVWFNFMWVRGSYLHDVVRPYPTSHRYYYEHWVAHLDNNKIFDRSTIKHFYHVEQSSFGRGQLSGCGDGWSMCLVSYKRGISFTPKENMPNYFSCPNHMKHTEELVNITSKYSEKCILYNSVS